MNPSDKILKGISLKEQGNACFSKGEYTNALKLYHEAICYLKGLDSGQFESFSNQKISNNDKSVLKLELEKIKSNMSAVYLKLQKYQKVIDLLTDLGNDDAKGFYRRGTAFKELKMFDKALQDLKKAALLLPMDKGIRTSLELVLEELKIQDSRSNQDLKDKLGGIF